MSLRNQMLYEKKKEKIKVDGKEYDLSDFDDTRRWSKVKKTKK